MIRVVLGLVIVVAAVGSGENPDPTPMIVQIFWAVVGLWVMWWGVHSLED